MKLINASLPPDKIDQRISYTGNIHYQLIKMGKNQVLYCYMIH